jgi:hypothetical protein
MSSISTKKTLIVSAALVAAMVCTGIVAASAHAVLPNKNNVVSPTPQGIPAIPPPHGNTLLSVPAVLRYLDGQGFVGGPTRNGVHLAVQNVQLTDIGTLNKLAHIFIPGLPSNEKIYYTQLKGPFVVSPNLSRPVLNTLLPGANNLPVLHTLLPDVRRTPGLNNLLGFLPLLGNPANGVQSGQNSTTSGNQPATNSSPKGNQAGSGKLAKGSKTGQGKTPASSKAGQGKTPTGSKTGTGKSTGAAPASLGKLPTTHPSGLSTILQHVYEVFDARTGNLLAWG